VSSSFRLVPRVLFRLRSAGIWPSLLSARSATPRGSSCSGRRGLPCRKSCRLRQFPRHAGPQPAISPEYKRWLDEVPVRGEWQQTLNEMRANGSSELGLPIVANGESRDYIGAPVVDLVLGQQSFQESCKIATQALEELIHRP
jgi:hypothetical protein